MRCRSTVSGCSDSRTSTRKSVTIQAHRHVVSMRFRGGIHDWFMSSPTNAKPATELVEKVLNEDLVRQTPTGARKADRNRNPGTGAASEHLASEQAPKVHDGFATPQTAWQSGKPAICGGRSLGGGSQHSAVRESKCRNWPNQRQLALHLRRLAAVSTVIARKCSGRPTGGGCAQRVAMQLEMSEVPARMLGMDITDFFGMAWGVAGRRIRQLASVVLIGLMICCPAAVSTALTWYATHQAHQIQHEIKRINIMPEPTSSPRR